MGGLVLTRGASGGRAEIQVERAWEHQPVGSTLMGRGRASERHPRQTGKRGEASEGVLRGPRQLPAEARL